MSMNASDKIELFLINILIPLLEGGKLGTIHVPTGSSGLDFEETIESCSIGVEGRMECEQMNESSVLEVILEDPQTGIVVDDFDGLKRKVRNTSRNYISRNLMTSKGELSQTGLSFTQMLAVCATVSELVHSGLSMSLRDVYYCHKHLFKTQQQCDSIVLDLGRTLGLRRHEMGIIPASKGFVAGCLTYSFPATSSSTSASADLVEDTNSSKQLICCLAAVEHGGMLISPKWASTHINDMTISVPPSVKLLLVVEKEGIYQRLLEDKFHERIPCIIVTGCGFPDVATRALVSKISTVMRQNGDEVIVAALSDYNPFGAALTLSYKMTSSSSRSSFEVTDDGVCPQLCWLGLRSAQFAKLHDSLVDSSALQPFTITDSRKIDSLIRAVSHSSTRISTEWLEELKLMKATKVKCELEALYATGVSAISDFVTRTLREGDYLE